MRIPVLGGFVSAGLVCVAIVQTVVAGLIAIISRFYAALAQSEGALKLFSRAGSLTQEGLVNIIFNFFNMVTLGLPLYFITQSKK